MRPDVQTAFNFQRRYIPEMKRIIGEHLIGEAPAEEDTERNTDLIVLRLDAVRIACRVRQGHYFEQYPEEFTVRASRPNGAKTELAKIIEGWGDYMLYAFAKSVGHELLAWTLIDLNVFRLWHSTRLANDAGKRPGLLKPNHDGSSDFYAFRLTEFPPNLVIGYKRPEAAAA